MDLFGMPTGGSHHGSSKTNGRGENLKSPPHPSCLTRFDAHTCKSCRLLLLSRAKSCSFGLAVATTSTRRSSRPNSQHLRQRNQLWELVRQRWCSCLPRFYLFPSWSLLLPTTAPWAWPAVLLPMEHSESLHAIVIFLAGSSWFFFFWVVIFIHDRGAVAQKRLLLLRRVCKERKKPEVFYNSVLFIRVSGFRAEFTSSLFLRKTCRRDFFSVFWRGRSRILCARI